MYVEHPHHNSGAASTSVHGLSLQPFSKKSRTPTVAIEFQIGLYDPAEADLELFCNSWSAGFLGERLYAAHLAAYRLYPFGFW